MMKNRITWIDMAKGYGTILVIIAHIDRGELDHWINSFHMALFFFLSGYVFSAKNDFISFFKKKCRSIVVPYFCLGIPMVLFQLFVYAHEGNFTVENSWALIKVFLLQNRIWTLWYIACLFCLNIIFYWIVRLCKSEWMMVIIAVSMCLIGLGYYHYGGQALIWSLDVCFTAMPFFYLGYAYKIHGEIIDEKLKNKFIKVVLFLFFGLINIVFYNMSLDDSGIGMIMAFMRYGKPHYAYIAAFAGVFSVVALAKVGDINAIKYLGENSMLYYAWHQTIILPLVRTVLVLLGFSALANNIVVVLVLIILILFIIECSIKKAGLGFVLGK